MVSFLFLVKEDKRKPEVCLPLPYPYTPPILLPSSTYVSLASEEVSVVARLCPWSFLLVFMLCVSPPLCEGRTCGLLLTNRTCKGDSCYFHDYVNLCLVTDSLESLSPLLALKKQAALNLTATRK